ncbi:MAG: Rrf2 family transcriptional regulator [Phycisphaerales bacterium]
MLTQTAEYALRAISALAARKGQTIPATELAEQADVPPPYLAKIMQQLASTELVTGRRGIGGGYTLSADPDQISALDVILAVGPIREPQSEAELERLGDGYKSLHRALGRAAESVIDEFRRVKISEIEQDIDAIRRDRSPEADQPAVVQTLKPENRNSIAG